jgi:hypothetical protein
MRREVFLHFSFWLSFFVFVAIFKGYLELSFWAFWFGGIVGTILPDIDHILYLYLKPQELTSQRFSFLLNKHDIKRTLTLLYETRSERRDLIFHTVFFQIIFLILTFWILTSSVSFFGKGIVLAFSLHLLIDQIIDLTELKSFDNWLKSSPWPMDFKRAKSYWTAMLLVVCLFGFLL